MFLLSTQPDPQPELSTGTLPSSSVRLLIADNHDLLRRGVRNLFDGRDNYRVVADARDGREAVRLAEHFKPNIAIVDYVLSALGGLELIHAMKRASPDTKILLHTMDNGPVASGVLEAGVRGFILKSDSESSLIDAAEALSMGLAYLSPSVWDEVLGKFLESEPRALGGVLSQRERQVVQLVAEGWISTKIAWRLGISVKTVEVHRSTAMRKMRVKTLAGLVRWAIKNNLVLA